MQPNIIIPFPTGSKVFVRRKADGAIFKGIVNSITLNLRKDPKNDSEYSYDDNYVIVTEKGLTILASPNNIKFDANEF